MENQIHEISNKAEDKAMQLVTSSILPMVLKSTIELGVLEIIDKAGPKAMLLPSEIASQIPNNHNPNSHELLDKMLSLLASHSILTCSIKQQENDDHDVQRLYGLGPVSMYFIKNKNGGSFSPLMFLLQDKVMIDMWFHLSDSVLKGGVPFEGAYGMNAVSYVGQDAKFADTFRGSMGGFNILFMEKLLGCYGGFEGINSLVDVGGGTGSILNMIISKYPSIEGINYDLPEIIGKSPAYPGIKHVAGDMFLSIPKGDAIFMKWILHGQNDSNCIKILENCYEALPDRGKVIVIDLVIPEFPEASLAHQSLFQMHMFMLNTNLDGKERTKKEFETLARTAGFSCVNVAFSAYNFSAVEICKG